MTTAQKREKFIKEYPEMFEDINDKIAIGEFRAIDEIGNFDHVDTYVKEYIITLLCDELIKLTGAEQ
jgi:hypothetical protein